MSSTPSLIKILLMIEVIIKDTLLILKKIPSLADNLIG